MRTTALCPISNKKINEKIARINSGFGILFIVLFLLTQNILPIIFLGIDFFLRSSNNAKYSPIRIASAFIAKNLKLKPIFINEGPKRFAARIGFVFSIIIISTFLFQATIIAFSVAGVLILFSFLEGAFGLCVACEIYPFVYKYFYNDSFTVRI